MKIFNPGSVIGILGGGQLGRMTALAAATLGMKTHIFTDEKDSPASHVADKVTVASYSNKKALIKFAKEVDLVTFEFENIPLKTANIVADITTFRPNLNCLAITQNRLLEKDFLNNIGVKTAKYKKIENNKDFVLAFKEVGVAGILKTATLGYDGKGQYVVNKNSKILAELKISRSKPYILEEKIDFIKEISVIIARGIDGSSLCYVPAENIHKNGILDVSVVPAKINDKLEVKAYEIAKLIADKLDLIGILAVEFFVTKNDELLVNELAPRPHNSGHFTLDACYTSQFEQFIRAICGWPLGSNLNHSAAEMKNLIGNDIKSYAEFLQDPANKLHLYGKKEIRDGRKMGHVTKLLRKN